ncbi:hypothetical protein ACOMHN_062175 [Nucella lapillus]
MTPALHTPREVTGRPEPGLGESGQHSTALAGVHWGFKFPGQAACSGGDRVVTVVSRGATQRARRPLSPPSESRELTGREGGTTNAVSSSSSFLTWPVCTDFPPPQPSVPSGGGSVHGPAFLGLPAPCPPAHRDSLSILGRHMQHVTARHGTARHGTARHGTARTSSEI